MRKKLIFLLLMLGMASPLRAQRVQLRGYGEADLDAVLRAATSPGTLVLVRDTLVKAGDTIRTNVLVLRARFILEGTVVGDLTGVEANMYLRPAAVVTGKVTNIAGGLYPSELARTGSIDDRPLAPYHLLRSGDDYVIEGTVRRPALGLLGGFRMPEYNRVDGLRVEVGPSIALPPFAGLEPTIRGSIGYATEREDFLGRAALELKRGRSMVVVGWEDDVTATNDAWIRGPLTNSIAVLWEGKDYRNYHAVDRTYLEFRRILERGARVSGYWLRAQNEQVHPLAAGDPWTIFEPDSIRSNPLVPRDRVTSAFLGAHTAWTGTASLWRAEAAIEVAGNVTGTNTAYKAYTANALYAMKAIANHTLEIETWFRGPLPGTDALPLQRWTFVGGSGTLYTHEIAEFPGDRLAFVESEYTIPFAQQFTLPVLGAPRLKLMHNIGMAWSHEEKRGFEQNLGVRLQFALAYVRYVFDPETGDGKFAANVSLPGKAYPWEKSPRPNPRR
jgi:hypothetical protein